MANVKMKWHGEKVERMILKGVSKNLDRAAMEWVRFAQQRLSVAQVSRPMDYPGKDMGQLRRNIAWEKASELVRRVGTNVLYGRFLELGTKFMQKRPWMTLTNNLTRTKLAKIIGRKI